MSNKAEISKSKICPLDLAIFFATDDVARVISSVGAWKQKTYNRGLSTGKLNKTVFKYAHVTFHSGNRNISEYLRQREFNIGSDYIGDR